MFGGLKGERNERDNEAGTSQRYMPAGDERSGFQSKAAGGFLAEEGEGGGGYGGACASQNSFTLLLLLVLLHTSKTPLLYLF